MMVLVPVLAPRCQLEGSKPPHVHAGIAGIAFFNMFEMGEAVHQTLHVQGVDQADGAHPEEAHPAKTENQANAERENNDGCFGPAPDLVDAPSELRRPEFFIGGWRSLKHRQEDPPKLYPQAAVEVFGVTQSSQIAHILT